MNVWCPLGPFIIQPFFLSLAPRLIFCRAETSFQFSGTAICSLVAMDTLHRSLKCPSERFSVNLVIKMDAWYKLQVKTCTAVQWQCSWNIYFLLILVMHLKCRIRCSFLLPVTILVHVVSHVGNISITPWRKAYIFDSVFGKRLLRDDIKSSGKSAIFI